MEKETFFQILCTCKPEELNKLISDKGSKKMVNAITFFPKENKKLSLKEGNNNDDRK